MVYNINNKHPNFVKRVAQQKDQVRKTILQIKKIGIMEQLNSGGKFTGTTRILYVMDSANSLKDNIYLDRCQPLNSGLL